MTTDYSGAPDRPAEVRVRSEKAAALREAADEMELGAADHDAVSFRGGSAEAKRLRHYAKLLRQRADLLQAHTADSGEETP